ncbi:MAG: hypothetical protein CR988_06445 [Treponema sp.]|nr:MAG: hypothetical protein CR988_06445 [Treponema sp.]
MFKTCRLFFIPEVEKSRRVFPEPAEGVAEKQLPRFNKKEVEADVRKTRLKTVKEKRQFFASEGETSPS